MPRIALIVIDGQNDFLANGNESDNIRGALCVEGAWKEAIVLREFISKLNSKINSITATLDSHQLNDCSHNVAWKDKNGNNPPPFTIITHEIIQNETYLPIWDFIPRKDSSPYNSKDWALEYVDYLENFKKPPLCLWPVHCQIGTWGSNVYPTLDKAYNHWCAATNNFINYVHKGMFPFSEHYSVFKPEAEVIPDRSNSFNKDLYQFLSKDHDIILWAGWAGSHCLRFSGLDAIKHSFEIGDTEFAKKCVFLEDVSAPVPDLPGSTIFADMRLDFLNKVQQYGASVTTTKDFVS